jgi:hypothetical protein
VVQPRHQPLHRRVGIALAVHRHFAAGNAQPVHRQVVRDGEGPGAPGRTLRPEAAACRDDPQPGSPGTPRRSCAASALPSRRRTKRYSAASWRA